MSGARVIGFLVGFLVAWAGTHIILSERVLDFDRRQTFWTAVSVALLMVGWSVMEL